ncbi:nuclear transport factor 2 family protein [Ensifer sp. MJa1]|uniref:nuclear transport factor 2 family protein n=1 Tax=Ensifer sp. MJa1 TaxID=2919888 RepID=UPI003007FAF2
MPRSSELKRAVQALYRARIANDIDTIMAQLDPEFSFRIAASGRLGAIAMAVNTPESVRSTFLDLMDSWDLSGMKTIGTYVDGETIVTHRSGTIRFIPSDTEAETEFIDKFTFRNGRIIDFTEFVDTLFVAETIGLLGEQGDHRDETADYSPSTLDRMSL